MLMDNFWSVVATILILICYALEVLVCAIIAMAAFVLCLPIFVIAAPIVLVQGIVNRVKKRKENNK